MQVSLHAPRYSKTDDNFFLFRHNSFFFFLQRLCVLKRSIKKWSEPVKQTKKILTKQKDAKTTSCAATAFRIQISISKCIYPRLQLCLHGARVTFKRRSHLRQHIELRFTMCSRHRRCRQQLFPFDNSADDGRDPLFSTRENTKQQVCLQTLWRRSVPCCDL